MRCTLLIALGLALLAVVGCGSDSSATTSAAAPAAGSGFTTHIDNPWWPMRPGTRWVYREGGQRVVVTVTHRTKRVASGVRGRVVHDVVSEKGRVVEDTYDWYAQDSAGNVWYVGEDTKEYGPGGRVSTKGSWEAGVRGGRAGIVMLAHPRPGRTYRQEYLRGEAEDEARVLRLDGSATVPYRSFSGLLVTRDFTRLEPTATERKYYARGIGPVLSVAVKSGARESLVSVQRP